MKTIPQAGWTVHRTLQNYPTAARIFIQMHTDCLGCPLARFCTLEEVEFDFRLPAGSLVEQIQEVVKQLIEGSGI